MIQIDMEMPKNCLDCNFRYQSFCSVDGHHEPHLEKERCPLKVTPQEPTIKALGKELRKARKGIADEKVLIGYNLAVAICNKHLGEVRNNNVKRTHK